MAVSDEKKRTRAETAIGTVNTDLTRTQPSADPRFYPDADPLPDQPMSGGVTITGASPNSKISAQPPSLSSTLPGYPKEKPAFTARKP